MTGGRYDLLLTPTGAPAPSPSASRKRRKNSGEGNAATRNAATRAPRARPRKPSAAPPGIPVPPRPEPARRPQPRRRKLPPTVIVTSVDACQAAVRRLSRHARIAVDCEGVSLSRRGRLCLVQIASPDAVFFFDVVGDGNDGALGTALFEQGGLKKLLENPEVWKVMHDCRHDSDALYHQFGVTLGPVIDTQVVFSVLRKARGMPEGLPVSMKTLLKKFACATEEELAMKNSVKDSMRGDGDFWLKRSLSEQAVQYARLDVEHLLYVADLLGKYIKSADENAWAKVVVGSKEYVTVFRDDENGPRKAQQQYEQLARVARRQRVAFETNKRLELHQRSDPMRKFVFDHTSVLQSLAI